MENPEVLAVITKGSTFPEWLIEITPLSKQSVLGKITANVDLAIIGWKGFNYILPASWDEPPISIHDSQHLKLAVIDKPLVVPINFQILIPEGVDYDRSKSTK